MIAIVQKLLKTAFAALLIEFLETALLTLLIFALVRGTIQNFRIEGSSMEPTLHDGQYLMINKAMYWQINGNILARLLPGDQSLDGKTLFLFHPPERGDIIVFKYPRDVRRDFIKRVIAIPGDTVEIRQGKVFINGQPLQEDYVASKPNYSWGPQQIPPGYYFVLGDNRNYSSDSHIWGLVPAEDIIGKAWLRYWPPNQWGLLPSPSLMANGSR
ncbi:MAG: signal peptidase I [Chloroflexi bacterium]|nr:signal peptidase I [Chloroflexota bacterium]MCL5075056.1 signal peptidase I [Chloroflexota bacterium]